MKNFSFPSFPPNGHFNTSHSCTADQAAWSKPMLWNILDCQILTNSGFRAKTVNDLIISITQKPAAMVSENPPLTYDQMLSIIHAFFSP